MNELALFAGAGGGILGGHLLGWRTVCAVENNRYAASVLVARQNDGCLPPFPIWDDVRQFDGRPWRGVVDVVSGGFPCQDVSVAGTGAGIDGERSGLWKEFARIVREVVPRYVFVENSPALTARGLGRVLGDLAAIGYDAEWCVLGAHDVGAWHKRDRIWIAAHSNCARELQRQGNDEEQRGRSGDGNSPHADIESLGRRERRPEPTWQQGGLEPTCVCASDGTRTTAHTDGTGLAERQGECCDDGEELSATIRNDWWNVEPGMVRVVHGLANRVDRIKCLGNGQVPAVAALAWKTLIKRLER
jgi:DNA (cytosine-5)-methyltransferase 1